MIAERQLSYRDDDGQERPLVVQIGKPTRRADDTWTCAYHIGAPHGHDGVAHGEDSIQALHLALVAAGAHLRSPALRGRVTWFGMEDLGFPAPSPPVC